MRPSCARDHRRRPRPAIRRRWATSEILPNHVHANGQSLREHRPARAPPRDARAFRRQRGRPTGTPLADRVLPAVAIDNVEAIDTQLCHRQLVGGVLERRRERAGPGRARVGGGADRRGVAERALRTDRPRRPAPPHRGDDDGRRCRSRRHVSRAEGMHVLVEPHDRGTAATILLPIHWIHLRDPKASVVVVGDLPATWDEAAVANHVGLAARCAERHAESLILTGLPRGPRPSTGSSCPASASRLGRRGAALPGRAARRPRAGRAAARRARDGADPRRVHDRVHQRRRGDVAEPQRAPGARRHVRRPGARALGARQAYALAPRVDFFRSVLREIARSLAVIAVAPASRDDAGRGLPAPRSASCRLPADLAARAHRRRQALRARAPSSPNPCRRP